ncbi:GNAT family N-acetyltransferase [Ureibacillus terrenus]|uniref:GNAT family N-acetyltransferase n=1 Tax=Ureibacillus terrenus TaxID=118246 RepID=UPI002E1E9477|nr:GNAT family N-acetyltransferase [Ureibacillus terrenus]
MEFKLVERGTDYFAFEYKKDGEVLAEITWNQRDGIMDMTHTFLSPQLRGQGVAKKLLEKAAEYAREHNYKMNPICSYVVAEFQKGEYDDVKA